MRDLPEGTVSPDVLKQLETASALLSGGEKVTAEDACSYFSLVAEAQGLEAGTNTSVTYYPDKDSAVAVIGQQCVDGWFTSLVVGRPDAAGNDTLPDNVTKVMRHLN